MGALASPWPWLRRILLVVVGTYLALGLLAWIFQRRLIYFPDARAVSKPRTAFWEAVQEVAIKTSDGETIQAWYLAGTKPITVIVFHGNAGHRGHRTSILENLNLLGYGVLLPDYRGYGGSTGAPSEDGLYADAKACRKWVDENAKGQVVYLGNSIGTGVAVELALHSKPAALVLRSPFSSLPDVGQNAYPFFPVRLFMRENYDNEAKIARVGCPVLMIHGDRDRIIPMKLGKQLFDAAKEPKQWLSVGSAGHNDLEFIGGKNYWREIGKFLQEHVR